MGVFLHYPLLFVPQPTMDQNPKSKKQKRISGLSEDRRAVAIQTIKDLIEAEEMAAGGAEEAEVEEVEEADDENISTLYDVLDVLTKKFGEPKVQVSEPSDDSRADTVVVQLRPTHFLASASNISTSSTSPVLADFT